MPASDAAREVRLGIKKVRFMVKNPCGRPSREIGK